jgi:hypothetical protein
MGQKCSSGQEHENSCSAQKRSNEIKFQRREKFMEKNFTVAISLDATYIGAHRRCYVKAT